MGWTDLILQYVVQIVQYIAWPATIMIILFAFSNEIKNLIGRIKKGRIGNIEFECDTTAEPPPEWQLPEKPEKPTDLSKEAKKILATLWKRQTYHFGNDFSKRWSFRILPNSEKYGIFMQGFVELLKVGLVGWTTQDGHAVLNKEGIEYIQKHKEIQEYEDIYRV